MRHSLVSLVGVSKAYGRTVAVNNVSLEVGEGEFVTLLGPSGSGKTTTLMLIGGFEQPTGGEILMRGEAVVGRPLEKRDIGMVFQSYALFPHMTVFDNLAFPLKTRRASGPSIAKRVEEALASVRMPGLGARYPRQLSGGQQQRVALARALVYRPSLLLMDEPLGALDKKLREEMQVEIKILQRELGITTLYVTHDQLIIGSPEAMHPADPGPGGRRGRSAALEHELRQHEPRRGDALAPPLRPGGAPGVPTLVSAALYRALTGFPPGA